MRFPAILFILWAAVQGTATYAQAPVAQQQQTPPSQSTPSPNPSSNPWPNQQVWGIKPSKADPSVQNFDDPSVIMYNKDVSTNAQLVVFLAGTGGKPQNPQLLLHTVAGQGYRVIGLEYDDVPAEEQVCPNLSPGASAAFREERIFGDAPDSPAQNPPEEAIVHRLVMLLRRLDKVLPNQGWGGYLNGDQPNWSRIVISGLSQGAGMAAYIAKRVPVARVVLFSCPRDYNNHTRDLAPWIFAPSATPLTVGTPNITSERTSRIGLLAPTRYFRFPRIMSLYSTWISRPRGRISRNHITAARSTCRAIFRSGNLCLDARLNKNV